MRESSTYRAIILEGRIDEARDYLIRLGKRLLGKPSDAIVENVRQISNLRRLHILQDRLFAVTSWEELFRSQ